MHKYSEHVESSTNGCFMVTSEPKDNGQTPVTELHNSREGQVWFKVCALEGESAHCLRMNMGKRK